MLNGYKTIIASLLGIVFTALPMLGIDISDVDQAQVGESVMGMLDRGLILLAFLGTIYGRVVAKKRVLTEEPLK